MKGIKWMAIAAVLVAVPALGKGKKPHAMDAGTGSMEMGQGGSAAAGGMAFQDKGSAKTRDEISKRVQEYERAMNAHDVDKMSSMYTADATVMSPDGRTATGRQDIKSMLKEDNQGAMKDVTTKLTLTSVRELSPTLAIVDIEQHSEGMPQNMPADMHNTVVVKKEGKQWFGEAVRVFPNPQMQQGVGGAGVQENQPMIEERGTGGTGVQQTQPYEQPQQNQGQMDMTQPRHTQEQMTPGGAQDEKGNQ